MNERIQELAEQAVFHACRELGNRKNWHQSFQEKFAELIVQECAEIIKVKSDYYSRTGYPIIGGSMAEGAELIRKHFGVE